MSSSSSSSSPPEQSQRQQTPRTDGGQRTNGGATIATTTNANGGAPAPPPSDEPTKTKTPHHQQRRNSSSSNLVTTLLLPTFLHLLSIAIYLRPLLYAHTTGNFNLVTHPVPILDEAHIVTHDNKDVIGTSTLKDVFINDYWGRPMNSPSSHKSWRPVSVLSFRWIKGWAAGGGAGWNILGGTWSELFVHRIVNVVLHASLAEMVSVLSTWIFPTLSPGSTLLMRCLTKLLFAVHPIHVEATANAANRPHLLAVLMSLIAVDPNIHLIWFVIALALGLLSSETCIFQVPAVLMTVTAIRYRTKRRQQRTNEDGQALTGRGGATVDDAAATSNGAQSEGEENEVEEEKESDDNDDGAQAPSSSSSSLLVSTIIDLLPRYVMTVLLTLLYLAGRHYYDTLSIPDGLIRPAENPFYEFTGLRRFLNYALVLSIHVGKAFAIDAVGFSHEYGFDCLREVKGWTDVRLAVPLALAVGVVSMGVGCVVRLVRSRKQSPSSTERTRRRRRQGADEEVDEGGDNDAIDAILLYLTALSWFATLFPVSGIVKVGTFIADRIVVASTVAVSIMVGRVLTSWILFDGAKEKVEETDDGASSEPSSVTRGERRRRRSWLFPSLRAIPVIVGLGLLWRRTDRRASEWMDQVSLLKSSLKSCPRSAKSNLEISKIYSGNYPALLNLKRAKAHLDRAERIDPKYCDVHQQFAHVLFQQQEYLAFEEQLTKAVMCPFTMSGAVEMWRRYWEHTMRHPVTGEAAKARMAKHTEVINEAIKQETAKEEAKKKEAIRQSYGGELLT